MIRSQRLLMILPHLEIGGAQRVAVNLANYWAQSGYDVIVLTTLEHRIDSYELDPLIERLVLQKASGVPRSKENFDVFRRCSHWLSNTEVNLRSRLFDSSLPLSGMDSVERRDFIWKTVNPRIHLLVVSVLTLRIAKIAAIIMSRSERTIANYSRKAKKATGEFRKRAAVYCLQHRTLGQNPKILVSLLRRIHWRVEALRKTLKEVEPDVVLSFLGSTNIITVAACHGLRCRVVISERNDPARQELKEPWQSLRPHIYPLADLITANSHGALEQLEDYCFASKLAYVANPVVMIDEPKRANRANVVLFLARLVHQKAPDILIEAFAKFSREHSDWTLEIAGDGPMEAVLKQRVGELGIKDQVTFHGMVKDPSNLLVKSRVFVLPSRFEGTPNSLLEAMASGMACIVTDASPGPLRLVEHEVSGLVVRTEDADDLASALSRLAKNPLLQEGLAASAKERTNSFRLENVAADWERLLFDGR